MSQQSPYAPPKAAVSDVVSTETTPSLWNPNAAACWSLLFSPIFGAFLHMRNWEALGQPEKAAKSKSWIIGSVIFFVLLALTPFVLPDSKGLDALGRASGLGLLMAWYYSIGKSQQVFVIARFGNSYPRCGWLKPILAAIGIVLTVFVVVFMLGFIAAVISPAA